MKRRSNWSGKQCQMQCEWCHYYCSNIYKKQNCWPHGQFKNTSQHSARSSPNPSWEYYETGRCLTSINKRTIGKNQDVVSGNGRKICNQKRPAWVQGRCKSRLLKTPHISKSQAGPEKLFKLAKNGLISSLLSAEPTVCAQRCETRYDKVIQTPRTVSWRRNNNVDFSYMRQKA